jgi:hypothetical protein
VFLFLFFLRYLFTLLACRDFIRSVLSDFCPEGLAARFPGATKIYRSHLSAEGPNHQHHADGHDKLNAQGLDMGGVGLLIYGIKDQWSSFLLHLVVVPSNRLGDTVAHIYLDMLEAHRGTILVLLFICSVLTRILIHTVQSFPLQWSLTRVQRSEKCSICRVISG